MKDHPHHRANIMGGMWGAKLTNETIRNKFNTSLNEMLKSQEALELRRGADQRILTKFIGPWVAKYAMRHQSYFCNKNNREGLRPFPTRRSEPPANFVGYIRPTDEIPIEEKCPIECRPKNHQDWEYC